MAIPRHQQIDLNLTPYYHCYVRCVRKGYLFGTGENHKNYDHRKGWVLEKMRYLATYFAIDICAYAIMSNHYHLVLRVNKEEADSWSDEQINERWKAVLNRKTDFPPASPEEMRRRGDNLSSISWFMRFLNEHIARLANKEDEVKGRFWESRFQSQALLDEGALLACMAYVDLNPLRAGMSQTLHESDYTSIQERLKAYHHQQEQPPRLAPLEAKENPETLSQVSLPFSLTDYLTLIDWTGRQLREDKPGFIAADVPTLVQAAGLNPAHWMKTVKSAHITNNLVVGALSCLKNWAQTKGRHWLKGQKLNALKYLTV